MNIEMRSIFVEYECRMLRCNPIIVDKKSFGLNNRGRKEKESGQAV